jgi:hypothetical protein
MLLPIQSVFHQPREYLEKLSWLQRPVHPVFYVGEELPISLDWAKATNLARGNVYAVLKKDGVLVKEKNIGNMSLFFSIVSLFS